MINLSIIIPIYKESRNIQKLAKFIVSDINKIKIITEQGILEGKFDFLPIQTIFFQFWRKHLAPKKGRAYRNYILNY